MNRLYMSNTVWLIQYEKVFNIFYAVTMLLNFIFRNLILKFFSQFFRSLTITFMFSTSIRPPPNSYVGLLENKLNHSFSVFGVKSGFSGSATTSHFLNHRFRFTRGVFDPSNCLKEFIFKWFLLRIWIKIADSYYWKVDQKPLDTWS